MTPPTPAANLSEESSAMKRSPSLLKYLVLLLSYHLVVTTVFAQAVPGRIDLVVAEGEGVVNNLRQRVAHDPVVRVEDDEHKAVSGAAVVFTLPISGASGEFGNGSKNLTVMTDKDGLAAAHGLKTNEVPGKLQIYVTASYRGLRARTLISQFNVAPTGAAKAHGGSSKVWIILAVVGAAAAGGVIAATHKGSSTTSSPTVVAPAPIGITPGAGALSPPH